MLAKGVNIFSGCQPSESNPVLSYIFYQRSILSHVACSTSASDSLPVSAKIIIQEQCIFQCCNGCSLCLDLLI